MTWFAVKGTEVSLKSWRLLQQWICVLATGKGELGERCVSDEDGLALRLAKRATRSDRSTLTFRSMPLTCHYGRHPRGTPGRSWPRNAQRTKHKPHEFKQFPS
jgi:hypothetical protein